MEKFRPSWESIWMNLAKNISMRSDCKVPNRNIGCIIVSEDNSRVLAMGYNGGAAGSSIECEYFTDSSIDGINRCSCVHAEMNALAKLNTTDYCNKICYLTMSPCSICAKLIVNSGIKRVVYDSLYNLGGIKILLKANIGVYHYNNEFDKMLKKSL